MGDLPQAGRFWWLTERDDDRADAAAKAFYERFGTMESDVLRALPRPMRPDRYPSSVRVRYEALIAAMRDAGIDWEPPVRHRPADYVDVDTVLNAYEPTWIDRVATPEIVGFVAVLLLVFAVFGLITIASAMVDLVTR